MTADLRQQGHERRFIRETGLAGDIAEIAEPVVEDLGYLLVRVVVSGRDGGTVQIMVERPAGGITVEECARISRELSPVLDAYAGDLLERNNLEVSSPGIDRPLVRESDFAAFAGHEARIELREAIEGRKRFRGTLEGIEDGEVLLHADLEGGARTLGFAPTLIAGAKLVMTDRLMQEALEQGGDT